MTEWRKLWAIAANVMANIDKLDFAAAHHRSFAKNPLRS